MKKKNKYLATALALTALIFTAIYATSCQQPPEMVPRQENTLNRRYKMPDPVPLSPEEQAIVENIRKEHNENTK